MRILSSNEMIQLLPAEPAELERAIGKFSKVVEACKARADWLSYAVKEGILEARQINFEGEPAFIVWFDLTPERRLVIDSAQGLSARALFPVLAEAVELLAKERNCNVIEFRTLRKGLVEQSLPRGYFVSSVVLSKIL